MKIAVAMSGGVDSSVTAALIKQKNPDLVFGIFMKNWSSPEEEKNSTCTWIQDRRDALTVAAQLDIPFKTIDCEAQYRQHVLEYFYQEYAAGRTPNPDILCNRFMKFDLMWQEAAKLGAEKMATGHYARVCEDGEGTFHLLKGKDTKKDQSYFLCRLTQEQLSHSLFPLGEMTKEEVRALAEQFGLSTAQKKDSQGICFIGKVDLKDFLYYRLPAQTGSVLDLAGKPIGKHDGAHTYTIGQRHGFTIQNHSSSSEPWFVVNIDTTQNTITVAQGKDNPALFSNSLRASDFHWINQTPALPLPCSAKVRYRQPDQACTIMRNGEIHFAIAQRAITPGQTIAFYRDDECLGAATIEQAL
ncbi:MAG: tRNA 2-thiouridine(34) synthase MnmA [Candidatus Abawacabacteria bacterium]|nr:tRNA 2-thiouridine(34) synthase MnmA [Candidatus Abawacabacteria bacterium]